MDAGMRMPEFLHLDGEYDAAVVYTCYHLEVYPNGNCAECGTFVTSCPGLDQTHKLVPRPKR